MEEPDWMTVLRIFWENNLSFEYTRNPEEIAHFLPDDPDLEGIDVVSQAQNLIKSGHLEVEDLDLEHDPTVPFDSMTVLRMSEKGLATVRNWEVRMKQAQWERQLLDTQEEYEKNRLERQQEFKQEQVAKTNEVNAAVGYLTVGLLIVTLSDVILSVPQDVVSSTTILGATTLVVVGLIYKIQTSGLLKQQ